MQKHENHPVRDVFLDLLTLEDGTDMSSWNVSEGLPTIRAA
jgi:hypothetical protein